MEQKVLEVGDTINGKKYRAESEVKETPRRHIELGVVKVKNSRVTFKIIEQTHRKKNFSQQNDHSRFKASNGIVLGAEAMPEWKDYASRLFCCGDLCSKDNTELTCTASEFAKISEAVSEYNITDGKGYKKLWPKKGDRYFFISGDITPSNLIFTDCAFDHNCQTCCNIFRTYKEAEAAADKVRALLKELAAK
jgi:hypothetical protein|nr:MAG TPA: hypothetical protein [Caudoviricetes sp.]